MSSVTIALWSVCLAGDGLVYIGQAFIAGRLLPYLLCGAYEALGHRWRLALTTAVTAPVINYLFSRTHRIGPPATAGAAALGTLVVVLVVNAALLGAMVTPRALLTAGATLAAATWLALELC